MKFIKTARKLCLWEFKNEKFMIIKLGVAYIAKQTRDAVNNSKLNFQQNFKENLRQKPP